MDIVPIEKLQYLTLGVEGENDAMDVLIDVSGWVDELVERGYENPCFHILFVPYNQSVPITCDANTEYDRDEKLLTWTVTESITQYAGLGYTEIRALNHPDNGLVKKTKAIPTMVDNSVSGVIGGTVPAPYDDWVNSILSLIDNLNTALDSAITEYTISSNYNMVPASGWSTIMPDLSIHKGEYLWNRTTINWSTGGTSYLYGVTYIGVDGSGAIDSVNGKTGIVTLYGTDIAMSATDATTLQSSITSRMLKSNIVYSNSQPVTDQIGKIWLKPKVVS